MTRNVVFGGFWKRLEVLGTLLELPSKLGGSGGAAPPQVIGVRMEMSSSYAVFCMLHALCCMLYAVLHAVCCILHAILKALGDARILRKFIKIGFGVVFVQFWMQIWILHEKLYIFMG